MYNFFFMYTILFHRINIKYCKIINFKSYIRDIRVVSGSLISVFFLFKIYNLHYEYNNI